MADAPLIEEIEAAEKAKILSEKNYLLAQKLYKGNNYYYWIVVILFYSACALVISVCNIKRIPVPGQHKGRWDSKRKIYVKGHLDIAEKYFNKQAYESYSFLLVSSQQFRYDPKLILDFEEDANANATTKKFFSAFEIIKKDYELKYNKST